MKNSLKAKLLQQGNDCFAGRLDVLLGNNRRRPCPPEQIFDLRSHGYGRGASISPNKEAGNAFIGYGSGNKGLGFDSRPEHLFPMRIARLLSVFNGYGTALLLPSPQCTLVDTDFFRSLS